MMTPLLVGRCEVRIEWSSRKIHCLPTKVDWLDDEEEKEERGISNCNGCFSARNTCCWLGIWLLTSCKCLSLNFWLEVAALLLQAEEAALDIASSSSLPPCWWLPCKLALDAAFFLLLGKVWWISLGVRFPVEKKPDSWLVLLASVPWAPAADQWELELASVDQSEASLTWQLGARGSTPSCRPFLGCISWSREHCAKALGQTPLEAVCLGSCKHHWHYWKLLDHPQNQLTHPCRRTLSLSRTRPPRDWLL